MWTQYIRPEHYLLLALLLVFHAVLSWLAGRGSQAKHAYAIIWTGIDCGMAAAWVWVFYDSLPWGYIGPRTLLHTGEITRLAGLCIESLAILWVYCTFTGLASGRASWHWLSSHVMLPSVCCTLVLFNTSLASPSTQLRCFAMALRYLIWLARHSFLMLQLDLLRDVQQPQQSSRFTVAWDYICKFAMGHSVYELYQWVVDHLDLLNK